MISHISTNEMTVNDLTKMLLLNKFKKFIELIEVLKIKISSDESSNSKLSNNEFSNDEFNNSESDETSID